MWIRGFLMIFVAALMPLGAMADDRLVRLRVPDALVETGALKYILPRFSLKTQVRVQITQGDADMVFGDVGAPLFEGAGRLWRMEILSPDHPGTARLVEWLTSDIGMRTILAYAPEGEALFTLPSAPEPEVVEVAFDGDPDQGLVMARAQCNRCHVVDDDVRRGIGSTPSFAVLRSLPDWADRFSTFYVLNPHPSFTAIDGVTLPFAKDRPPPIVPVTLTLEDLENVLAYVAAMTPADLGAPLAHQ
ncbi:hypothetical protein [Pseudoprimorskyibacter insulae]|uniref:Cytochrome c domain-containing protein n=1 Tax=Pseudoprimorskyibacter insulae TaxID=1695997 RepID=A0A2R8B0Q6_9RHOB|nr:hypothetical protein [Pseudoprimorskyibacter insulae]SPF81679.1 hypothetical protein PRI8871_03504 [Pseudoprimorskyibacter insulae]